MEEERKTFKEDGIKRLQESFNEYDVPTPEAATIYVHPEVVLLDTIDKETLMEQFMAENEGKYSSYSNAQRESEKYIVQNLPEKIKETPISIDENMDGEGDRIKLVKKMGNGNLILLKIVRAICLIL